LTADLIGMRASEPRDRLRILAGRSGVSERDRGSIICACFEVGLNDIIKAITAGRCMSVDAVGATLKAGTNCGSCRTEIGRLIHERRPAKAV
jgi:assimilatory nitrate reductase catalytic subunit